VVEGLAERGCHAHSSHNCCLKRIAVRLSTASALTAIYNAHSRRALDGHACRQCGVCTSGQPLDTRLAHVHAQRRHMLLARVCMDATHSEGSSLKVGHDVQLSLHLPQPHAVNLHPHRVALHLRRERSPPPAPSASRPLAAHRGARASAAHQVTRSPRARLLRKHRPDHSSVQRLRTLQLPCLFACSSSRPPPATRWSAPPVEYGAADYTACGGRLKDALWAL